jgi:glutaredoxin 3
LGRLFNQDLGNVARVEIYTSPFCGFCFAAKRLLEQKGVPYTEIDVTMTPGARLEMTERAGGARSVPQIFADGRHLGDSDFIHALEAEGRLDQALGLAQSARD